MIFYMIKLIYNTKVFFFFYLILSHILKKPYMAAEKDGKKTKTQERTNRKGTCDVIMFENQNKLTKKKKGNMEIL
jgi:hypothetical protein